MPQPVSLGKPASYDDFVLERRIELIDGMGSFRGGRLLDVGSGNGAQTLRLLGRFEEIVALDVVPEHLKTLREHVPPGAKLRTVLYDGGVMPFEAASFDAVLSIETLEHVADEAQTLREIHRVLAPGGTLVLSVPNKWWVFETHGARLPLLAWNRVPFFSWLPRRLHSRWARARIYTRRDVTELLQRAEFEIQAVRHLKAPMDAARPPALARLLRATLFAGAETALPILSTSIFVRAKRR